VGGVCLKYETNRGVEVGRLMAGFHQLGQRMQNVLVGNKRKGDESMSVDEESVSGPVVKTTEKEKEIEREGAGPSHAGGSKRKKHKR
jgi:Signal recognition particle 9 kDa protein (SRP9)